MKIKVLPDTVINQIAAGEVVERPASVVRELVDNAIDAGANDIFVALEGGGHSRLKVRDNGCGMSKDEAILAFERHATSKVSVIEDLASLATLGFRGEALASIAAVSKIQLKTRERESEIGTQVTFKGGKLTDVRAVPWNAGTEIEVEHLFFNTPARRKFLKSPRSEVARIRTWLAHSGLARPKVRYRLVSDGDEVLHLHPAESVAERAKSIFPNDLIPISLLEGGVAIEGMVSHPGAALSDGSGFVILVNERLVSDKLILKAAREGYDSMLKDREYPVGYISLTLPADHVDVNVHPQKSEVRFRHPQQVFALVQGAVVRGVRAIRGPVEQWPRSEPMMMGQASAASVTTHNPASGYNVSSLAPLPIPRSLFDTGEYGSELRRDSVSDVFRGPSYSNGSQRLYSEPRTDFRFADLRYVGQVLECYLVCELRERLVMVDMHAAHERVNYNKIRRARAERKLNTQKLLIPEMARLTEEQVVRLMEQEDLLRELGFEIAPVSAETVSVTGVPAVTAHLDCVALLKECAAEPLASGWRDRLEERIDHIAARVACHASVRSGDILNKTEVYALFDQLDEAEASGACPHGRPVVTEFSRDVVERWFGRDR
jgi:DNA mismatch repair protein MutL